MKYRPDVDGLRSLAVIPVVLFHAHIPGFSGGFVGVDIFFVISGYLICGLIAGELAERRFSLVHFYERRCRRILPPLFAMSAVVLCLAALVLLPPDMESFCRSLFASTFFVSNIYFWGHASYFDGNAEFKPFLHTWSLGVEEQFYIFMPLILWVIARWLKSRYTPWLLCLFVASLLLSGWGLSHAPTATFYLLPTRFWELTVGAILATSGVAHRPVSSEIKQTAGIAGLSLIAYSITQISEQSPFPGWNALYPCLGAAACIYAGSGGNTWSSRLLSTRPLVFVGQISYPLYLWHWPLLALAKYQLGRGLSPLETFLVVTTSVLCAIASWRYIERPVRQNVALFNKRVIFAGTGGAMLLVTALVEAGIVTGGFRFRYPTFALQDIPRATNFNKGSCFLDETQTFRDWRNDACFLTKGHDRTVLLWGDSYAAHYAVGVAHEDKNITADVLQYTEANCPPVRGYYTSGSPHCQEFNDNLPNVLKKYGIKTVVMSGRWESLFKRGVTPASVAATVAWLDSIGVKAIVIGQSPVFYNDVQTIFSQAGYTSSTLDAAAPISFNKDVNVKLAAALPAGTFIDPLSVVCKGGEVCNYRRAGQFLLFDTGHLSTYGSELAVSGYFPFYANRL